METTHPIPAMDTSVLGVVRILLLIQGGIAVLSTLEVSVAGLALGPAVAPLILLNLLAAGLTLGAARGLPVVPDGLAGSPSRWSGSSWRSRW